MYSNTSVFVGFDYCRFLPGKIYLGFRCLLWISSACLRDQAVSDKSEAEKSAYETKNYVEAERFIPQQVFNCDETGLHSKKMPKTTFFTQEEKALKGHNTLKNGLTLFFVCGDVSVDYKGPNAREKCGIHLLTYITGTPIAAIQTTPDILFKWGFLLAQFHNATEDLVNPGLKEKDIFYTLEHVTDVKVYMKVIQDDRIHILQNIMDRYPSEITKNIHKLSRGNMFL
ncbi:hypothetical protein AVEN_183747-1 [Araneus ventricosus]|uniref:Uncharacterized protein n=1 Tax=Araneus ventricosus TaxID=182803 RepID=A0A4Y2X6F4_ARAVE|nr:hypothetical protein AVEN_238913-1 [Araneus ventricosus]GBO44494.1 hypothetical protein AVEN_183747-1 [Araneus ventricosus]